MADKLDVNRFSLALASTMGVIYIICGLFVALWPNFSLQLFGWLIHLVNVDKFAGDVKITFGGLVIGLLQILVYTYISSWIFALLHNKFIKK